MEQQISFKFAYRQSSFEKLIHLDYFTLVTFLLVFGGEETLLGAKTGHKVTSLFIISFIYKLSSYSITRLYMRLIDREFLERIRLNK